jgi:hypothetical protein
MGLAGFVMAENTQETYLPATSIPRGHSHNDYYQQRPLFDALDNGFFSVEADIFSINDALLVAHELRNVRPEKTLETLYLEPLRERAQRFNGRIFPDAERFYLWIDFKTEARMTYAVLKEVLEKYADILTRYENNVEIPGAVTVILTGSANLDLIRNKPVRYAGVDGGGSHALDSDISATLMPAIGMNWKREFPHFNGQTLSPDEQKKLAEHVRKANENGRKLRYWNAPDNETLWGILYDAGVHFINTDRLEPLRNFLLERD